MNTKRKIEIFSAGCPICTDSVQQIEMLACSSCEVEVLDLHNETVAQRAIELGIRSIPAVLIDGNLADCCSGRGINMGVLQTAGLGVQQ